MQETKSTNKETVVKTGRFGNVVVGDGEIISIPKGILGFPQLTKYFLLDPGDDTLILWLQSMDEPGLAFPLLEPKVFHSSYIVRLSAAELQELKLDNINNSAVFSVLTIPEDVTQMTANLKAPLVINLKDQIAKQVVLQENEYTIKHLMFKELRAHLVTMNSQQKHSSTVSGETKQNVIAIDDLSPSLTVRAP